MRFEGFTKGLFALELSAALFFAAAADCAARGADSRGAPVGTAAKTSASKGNIAAKEIRPEFSRAKRGAEPSAARVKFLEKVFRDLLEKNGATAGGFCLCHRGKILKVSAWVLPSKDKSKQENAQKKFSEKFPLPVGRTSVALVSLAMLADSKIDVDKPVQRYCSQFKFAGGKGSGVSIRNLLSMDSGLPKSADALVPKDLSANELFEIAAQIQPVAEPGAVTEFSALGVQLACLAAAYRLDQSSKNLARTFVGGMKLKLFDRLGMDGVRLVNAANPIAMMNAFCISVDDAAKWLACETSPNPPFSGAAELSRRRVSGKLSGGYSMGWLECNRQKAQYYAAADDFLGVANIVAIYPSEGLGVAFFAVGPEGCNRSSACALALENFTSMISDAR